MHDADVLVIGSGAGGLAAAVALARAGKKVLVLERHSLPGGWCHSFVLDGYWFSPGVHYVGGLGPEGRLRALYEGLGVADEMVFLKLDPEGYDHVLVGDRRFDIPAGADRYRERLIDHFPRERRGIERYFGRVQRIGAELASGGLRVRDLSGMLRLPFTAPTSLCHGWRSLGSVLGGLIDDPVLRTILAMRGGDYGVPPARAPFVLHAALIDHYLEGAWTPMGGGKAIPRAFLGELKRRGGAIRLRSEVERILIEISSAGRRRAVGVRLQDGTELSAPIVISNADAGLTYQKLVGAEHLSGKLVKKLEGCRWSPGSMSLFLAVDMDLSAAGLDSGNYWIATEPDLDAASAWGESRDLAGVPPAVFATVTTLKDPSKRRDSIHTLELFSFVGWNAFAGFSGSRSGERPAAYRELKQRLADGMIARLETLVPGISERVVFRSMGSPLTNVRYLNSTQGNVYGLEKTLGQIGPGAFALRSEIDGLFLCGASTTAHGVAGAASSGLSAAARVLGCRSTELLEPGASNLRTAPADDPASWPQDLRAKVRDPRVLEQIPA